MSEVPLNCQEPVEPFIDKARNYGSHLFRPGTLELSMTVSIGLSARLS